MNRKLLLSLCLKGNIIWSIFLMDQSQDWKGSIFHVIAFKSLSNTFGFQQTIDLILMPQSFFRVFVFSLTLSSSILSYNCWVLLKLLNSFKVENYYYNRYLCTDFKKKEGQRVFDPLFLLKPRTSKKFEIRG